MTNEALYRKQYKMRFVGKDLTGVEVTMPRLVIEREARRYNLTVDEFLEQFVAVAHFNSIEGILYTFEPRK